MCRFFVLLCLLTALICSPVFAEIASDDGFLGGFEIGVYDKDGDFVPFNTKFEVKDGLVGWCMDDCPGILGDVTVNTSDVPVSLGVDVWEPGLIFVNSGLEGVDVVVRYKSDVSGDVNLVAGVRGGAGRDEQFGFKLKKMNSELANGVIDCRAESDAGRMKGAKDAGNVNKSLKIGRGEHIDLVVSPYDKSKQCGRVQIYFEVSDSKGSSGVMKLGEGSKSVKRFVSAMDAQIKREKTRISRQKDDNVKSALAIEERAR